jgi:hypothetical protein
MKRRSRALFLAGLCGVAIAAGASAVRAETPSQNPPPVTPATLPSAPGGASCSDDSAADARKRDAALAELGKRLSAEPKPDGDYQVLNRTGNNYGSGAIQR